jgi:hypothetical protein
MTGKLMEYFNKQPRIGVLSTSSREGKVDSAVLGSPQMTDENTVIMAFGMVAPLLISKRIPVQSI